MHLVLVAKNDHYQKTLTAALSCLATDITVYDDIDDVQAAGLDDLVICLCLEPSENKDKAIAFAQKFPVFSILDLADDMSEEAQEPFIEVFYRPFPLGGLVEAVRLYQRQKKNSEKLKKIQMGPYILDLKNSLLQKNAEAVPIRLTEKEQDILYYLYTHHGKFVTRQALLDNVWGYVDGVETHTLETHIYRLRQKIEIDPTAPQFLITNEKGYSLNF